jgi:hypothetical protein
MTSPWHLCDGLPAASITDLRIARCRDCGAFWKRIRTTGENAWWKPVGEFRSRLLRRRFDAKAVRS